MSTTPKNTNTLLDIPEEHISSTDSKLATIMRDIETKTEQKIQTIRKAESTATVSPGRDLGDTLVGIMSEGAKEFTSKTGRGMTYSEMRRMYG